MGEIVHVQIKLKKKGTWAARRLKRNVVTNSACHVLWKSVILVLIVSVADQILFVSLLRTVICSYFHNAGRMLLPLLLLLLLQTSDAVDFQPRHVHLALGTVTFQLWFYFWYVPFNNWFSLKKWVFLCKKWRVIDDKWAILFESLLHWKKNIL